MARCEVCGVEQYPANTVVRWDAAHQRHFFCSQQHADAPQEARQPVSPPEAAPEEPKEQVAEEDMVFLCHLCGFEAKNETGLAAHKRAKHKK